MRVKDTGQSENPVFHGFLAYFFQYMTHFHTFFFFLVIITCLWLIWTSLESGPFEFESESLWCRLFPKWIPLSASVQFLSFLRTVYQIFHMAAMYCTHVLHTLHLHLNYVEHERTSGEACVELFISIARCGAEAAVHVFLGNSFFSSAINHTHVVPATLSAVC